MTSTAVATAAVVQTTPPKPRLTAKQIAFCVSVLWMHGWSAGQIAAYTRQSRKAIDSAVERRFQTPRGELTDTARQMLLDELRAKRNDNGVLVSTLFIALPLKAAQLKRRPSQLLSERTKLREIAAAPTSTKPDGPMSRRAARKAKQQDAERKKQRENGHAPRLLAPFEHLCAKGFLTDQDDVGPLKDLGSSGRRRQEAGLKLRHYIVGTQVSGLKSLDYEGASGGGNMGLPPSAFKLFCVDAMGALRSMMSEADMARLEKIVAHDEYIWEAIRVRVTAVDRSVDRVAWAKARDKLVSKARDYLFEDIRRSLDVIAVYEGLLSTEGFRARWGYHLSIARKPSRVDAIDRAKQAAELVAAARK